MKLNKKKFERQKGIVDTWEENNYLGTLEAVTRFGKTFTAIIAAKRLVRDKPNAKIIVVVPTDYLRNKWRETLAKFSLEGRVDTVHNLVNENQECDLLILDEIHLYVGTTAEVFPTIFEKIKADRIFGLTATLGDEGINRELINRFCPVIDTVDMQEALKEKYIANYITFNFGIPLSPDEKREYDKLNDKFYKYFSTFDYKFDVAKACLDKDVAERKAIEMSWEPSLVHIHAIQFFRTMRERKDFLYSVDSKVNVAKQIVEKFGDKKFITFAQTTASADKLSSKVEDAESYHSNLNTIIIQDNEIIGEKEGKKYRIYGDGIYSWKQVKAKYSDVTRLGKKRRLDKILDDFVNNDLRVLCTAKKLDVGFDFDDIEGAIIISGSSKFRQNVQRTGRALNKKKDKVALIVQLYILDTQDEKWLNKRQLNMDNVKDIRSISELTL